ncbi:MAG: leucine-rich repeat domain-containing protein [Clostridiales bacterium]|nr:leucine-rich repeat domain-containing protein [Clostridiales bacterium]
MKKKIVSLLTAAAMAFAALPVVAENTDGETEEVTAIEETVSVDAETEIADEEENDSETEEVMPIEDETADELDVEEEVVAETEETLPIEEEEQPVDVSSATLEVQSTSGTCGDNLTWTLDDDGVLTISGTGDMEDYSSGGAPWYSSCESITNVEIGDEITSIGSYAFYNCTALMSITIPNSVISIGSSAFNGCSALEEITLPFVGSSRNASRTPGAVFGYIFGDVSYTGASSTQQYYSLGSKTYYIPSSLTKVTVTDATQIPYGAFYKCSNLVDITINDSISSIDSEAFRDCSALEEITLPFVGSSRSANGTYDAVFGYIFGYTESNSSGSTNQYYNNGRYYNYHIPSSLKKVTITDATQIPYNAFYNCSNLTYIAISESTTSIDKKAFYCCYGLEEIILPFIGSSRDASESSNTIFEYIFNGNVPSNLKKVTITDAKQIPYEAFYNCSKLTDITVSGSATNVGGSAFYGCTNLTNITLPNSITTIGDYAFYKCTNLTSAIIPDDVTNIGENVFENCTNLTDLTISNNITNIGACAFKGCTGLTNVYISDITSWLNISFGDTYSNPMYYTTNIYVDGEQPRDITIPNGVTEIPSYTFYNWASVTDITMPDSVNSIGDSAFYGCTALENVYAPNIESWMNITFSNATSTPMYYADNVYIDGEILRSVTVPDSITAISDYAFYNWTTLSSINISDNVKSIGEKAFYNCVRLANITLGNGITSIGADAFSGCSGLTNVYAPSIEAWLNITFSSAASTPMRNAQNVYINGETISSVTVPNSITEISPYAFYNWTTLTDITMSNSVTSIGYSAFSGCIALTKAITSDSVTGIGASAFSGCSQLTDVTLGSGLTSIGSNAFQNCSALSNVYIPNIEMWFNLTFGNDYSNPMYYAKNMYINGELATDVTIPTGTTEIPSSAFYSWKCLESVTIPESVTSISSSAFSGCTDLTSVTLPNSVTSIGDNAFKDCSALSNVYIPNLETWFNITFDNDYSNPMYYADNIYIDGELASDVTIPVDIEEIPSRAFYSWSCLENAVISDTVTSMGTYAFSNCGNLTNVTIGSGLTSISDYAFYKCSGLTNVSMTRSITDVGTNAFSGTNVFVVYFDGDEADWDYILWDDGNSAIQSATIIYNGDAASETTIKSGTCGDNISWTLSNFGNLVVSGTGAIPDYTSGSAPWYEYANYIKAIIVEDGITAIGDYAFYYIGTAKSITIPSSVTSIGYRAFYNCSAVNNLYIDDIALWMNIDFEDGTSNPMNYAKNVYVDNVLTTEIEIPSGTEAIKAYAFYGNSSLTSVSIPTSVTSIASSAFTNCGALNGISYEGSESEWQQISGYGSVSSATTVYYDGTEVPDAPTVITIQTPTVTQAETDDAWSFEVTLETTYADSTVFAAAYDANGALIGMSVTDLQTDGATTVLLQKYTDADVVKIFVWSDTTQPITTVWESEI